MKKQIIALTLLLTLGAHAEEKGFKSLFNGKNLTGWKNAKYEVKDGVLICRGRRSGEASLDPIHNIAEVGGKGAFCFAPEFSLLFPC